MLEWNDLHFFLAIARHRTLSAAARALGVQQTTMGRRLAALEGRAGTRLLAHTPQGYVLTEAGEATLAHVERIEAEALAVERAVSGTEQRLEGSVRLTAVETLAVELLTPVLARFRERYPGIVLELIVDSRSLSLSRREADVALRLARPTERELVARRLPDIATAAYASPLYLERQGHPASDGQGAGHWRILPHEELMGTPEMRWFQAATGRAGTALRSNSRYAQRAAAMAGMGIACLARYLGDAAGEALVRLDLGAAPPPRELWLAVHRDLRDAPRIRALMEALGVALGPGGRGISGRGIRGTAGR